VTAVLERNDTACSFDPRPTKSILWLSFPHMAGNQSVRLAAIASSRAKNG